MPKFKVYRLHFTSPVHFGDSRDDYGVSLKTIQSDTLISAAISALVPLGVDIPDDGNLGCCVSSLFPFYQQSQDDPAVYFFPCPQSGRLSGFANLQNAKAFKKVKWLDLKSFNESLNGNFAYDSGCLHGEFYTIDKGYEDFMRSSVSVRVSVDRGGEGTGATPFYMDRVFFKDYSGLFFLVNGDDSLLERGLGLLQYNGIGTDRNVGNGSFVFDKAEVQIDGPDNSDYAVSLSVFIPEDKEQLSAILNDDRVAYDFVRRGGWITTPPYQTIRKNYIYAFVPASVFAMPVKEFAIKGKIVDLKPDIPIAHPIWRDGRAIFLPIKR